MIVLSGKRSFEVPVTPEYDRPVKLPAYPAKTIGPKHVGAQDRKTYLHAE